LGLACTLGWENCSSSCASPRLAPNLRELTRTCGKCYSFKASDNDCGGREAGAHSVVLRSDCLHKHHVAHDAGGVVAAA